jgi:ring-1,2-phenylacetyl-CoA epoxidase subunit PaaD
MTNQQLTSEQIWQALEDVKDPEIPVVSVVEMGIVRNVDLAEDRVTVKMTPTFSGCPALEVMRAEIGQRLQELGLAEVLVELVLYPPWTSDWISEAGREKLRNFGLAPPRRHGGRLEVTFYDTPACPYCGSTNTGLRNRFGSTLCRSIHFCNECQQPFEQFKAL